MTRHPWHHWIDEKKGRLLSTLTLVHVISGTGRFRSDPSGEFQVFPGMVFFAFPGVRHYYGFDKAVGWKDEWLELEPAGLLPLLDSSGITPETPFITLSNVSSVSGVFRRLLDFAEGGASGGSLAARAYELMATVLENSRSDSVPSDPVEALKTRIAQTDGEVSIADLTRELGISESRLRTLFKAKTGLSPKQFQLNLRFERVCDLLVSTNWTVARIAEQTGFASAAALSTSFLARFGQTPISFRSSTWMVEK